MNISRMLCEEELEELEEITIFTQQEIKFLFERFRLLDRSNKGFITFNDLMMLPEFHSNPFSGIILTAIEETIKYENMTFPYFLEILQIFHKKTEKKERIRFLFKAFDLNKDGKLCSKVLERLYKILYGEHFDEIDMVYEIKKVLNLFDQGNKGYMNYKDFYRFYNMDSSIDEILKIEFDKESCKIR